MLLLPAELPSLREDLRLYRSHKERGGQNWLIYDPVRHRYFQISETAFEVVSNWRAVGPGELSHELSAAHQRDVSLEEIDEILCFLVANSLVIEPPGADGRAYAAQQKRAKHAFVPWLIHSYLFFRIPLVRPHRFLEATSPYLAPLFGRVAHTIILFISLFGVYLAARQWDVFVATFLEFLTLEGLAFYLVSLVFVKVLHELGHAYAATRAGVRVNTMGVAFMVMMPLLYTDVTDAWRLPRRRDKLAIDAAGIAVELAVAGIATFLWVFVPDGPLRSILFVLATTSWIMSLVVNLNPFMRFDGYYILCDLSGIANLQNRSNAMARWWLRETLFGLGAPAPEDFPRKTRRWLIPYAFGVWIYRLVLFIGIALIVYHMFFKVLGVILFVVEIVWFIALPIWNEFTVWWKIRKKIMRQRRSLITAGVLTCLLALAIIPWSGTVRVPAVALAEEEIQLFASRPAQVESILVREGQRVATGMALAVLRSPELDFELAQTDRSIELVEARLARIPGDSADLSSVAILRSERDRLAEKKAGLLAERDMMVLSAPIDGVVRDTDHDLRAGEWINITKPLARIVNDEAFEVQGYVREDDLWRLRSGGTAIFVPEDPTLSSRDGDVVLVGLTGIETMELTYLSSLYGGPIASDKGADGRIRPRSARYLVRAKLEGKPLPRVVRGTLLLDGRPESFAVAAWRRVLQMLVRESGV